MKKTQLVYPVQTVASTPEPTKQLLADIAETFGSIPPILGIMANAPSALESYQRLSVLFGLSDFTPLEAHAIYLTIIRENNSTDLADAHVSLLKGWFDVPESIVDSILSGSPTGDAKLDILLDTPDCTKTRGNHQGNLARIHRCRLYRKSAHTVDDPCGHETMTSYLERLSQSQRGNSTTPEFAVTSATNRQIYSIGESNEL